MESWEELTSKWAQKGQNPNFIENPLSVSLRETIPHLQKLDFTLTNFIPSLITGVVLLAVIAIQIIIWPYGWIPVIGHFLWGFVSLAQFQIVSSPSYIQKMPHTVALGIYFAIWLPVALLCLPLLLIGLIGELIATNFD